VPCALSLHYTPPPACLPPPLAPAPTHPPTPFHFPRPPPRHAASGAGRLSFEESRELLERANPAASGDADDDDTDATSPTAAAEAPGQAPSPLAASEAGSTCPRGGGGGLALSMEARHALLSATYEHVLGDGLRALVRDVERAVSRCTHK